MAKSDHQTRGCLRFKWDVSAHVVLVCIRFVRELIAVSFVICCKIVMSKYNLLKSVSITRSSMFMRSCPHPDHAQVKVGHTHTTDMVN